MRLESFVGKFRAAPRMTGAFLLVAASIVSACGAATGSGTQSSASATALPTAKPPVASATALPTAKPPIAFTKPLAVIVNQAPGGGADLNGRVLASGLAKVLGVSAHVENITAAGGVDGVNRVYDAPPDGTVLGALLLPRTLQQEILLNTKYKTGRLTPIAGFIQGPFVLLVKKDAPYADFKALVEASKQKPINIGVTGAGSATDLQAAVVADVAGARFTRIPFDGAAPALTAVLGGHVDAAFAPLNKSALSESFRILLVPTAKRLDRAPQIPAMGDYGLPAADISFYQALFGPPDMSEEMRAALEQAVKKATEDPEHVQRFKAVGEDLIFKTGAQLQELIKEQAKVVEKYKDLLK